MPDAKSTLYQPNFPRSNAYEPNWVMDTQMGPNALWLAEWLSEKMDFKPGMRVLDLGCGKAATSIFFAREFDLQVWACDLWVNPDGNAARIREAGLEDKIFPMLTEAHALPFAQEFFDAVVSIDSYQYFGTDALYLHYLSRFLKPGGKIGIAVPGWMKAIGRDIPKHLTEKQANGAAFWEDECACFQTVGTWKELWSRTGRFEVIAADTLASGWKYWRDFECAVEQAGKNRFPSVAEALEQDRGEYLGFVRLVAERQAGEASLNLYKPSLMDALSCGDKPQD